MERPQDPGSTEGNGIHRISPAMPIMTFKGHLIIGLSLLVLILEIPSSNIQTGERAYSSVRLWFEKNEPYKQIKMQ